MWSIGKITSRWKYTLFIINLQFCFENFTTHSSFSNAYGEIIVIHTCKRMKYICFCNTSNKTRPKKPLRSNVRTSIFTITMMDKSTFTYMQVTCMSEYFILYNPWQTCNILRYMKSRKKLVWVSKKNTDYIIQSSFLSKRKYISTPLLSHMLYYA